MSGVSRLVVATVQESVGRRGRGDNMAKIDKAYKNDSSVMTNYPVKKRKK